MIILPNKKLIVKFSFNIIKPNIVRIIGRRVYNKETFAAGKISNSLLQKR